MKIILLQNVPDVGQKGEIKEVKSGYWRNFLMPRRLAMLATDETVREFSERKNQEVAAKSASESKIKKELEALKDKIVTVELKAGKTGSLFSGLDAKKISRLIREKLDLKIPAELINIEKPIKQIGSHNISVKNITFKLEINALQ